MNSELDNSGLDELLEACALLPPTDVTRQVMQQIASVPQPRRAARAPAWLPWVAVASGVIVGIGELARFVFSAWITGSAG